MLTAAEILLLSEELDACLGGARLQKIHSPREDRLVFHFFGKQGKKLLLVDLGASSPRLHLTSLHEENPERPAAPIMRLRELLQDGRLVQIQSLKNERIVRLDFRVFEDEREHDRRAFIELFGRSRNLFVTDADERILFHYREPPKSGRALKLAAKYVPPPRRDDSTYESPPAFAWIIPGSAQETLSEAIERSLAPKEAEKALAAKRELAETELVRRRKKDAKLKEHLLKDCERASRAESVRHQAELLKQNLGSLVKGDESATLTDWSTDPPTEVLIPLDRSESPTGTVARLFREAKKLETSWAHASQELGRIEDRLGTLDRLLEALRSAQDDSSLEKAIDDCVSAGLFSRPVETDQRTKKPEPEERRPFKVFHSVDGFEILVGRTAAENDELTFKVARGGDLWLHVADYPGSHVVVRMKDATEIPEQTLLDAAFLAGHYSKAPKGAHPSVSWTRAKYVKKFKGAAPGQVQLAERKTIKLREDPARTARLLG